MNRRGGNRTGRNGDEYPTDRQVGRVDPPSGRLETYEEGNLFRVAVPSNWRELPSNASVTFAPEGGESGVSVLARVLPAIREIIVRHAGQSVLAVSHKATIRILLSSLLGFDTRGYRDRLDQAPACLNVLDFRDHVRARLMLFNDTSHYQDRPRAMGRSLSRWWDEKHTRP